MVDLAGMMKEMESGKELDDILQKYDWKFFEGFVSDVFKENDFQTKLNFRFKTTKRFEIDVVAARNNKIFCIDCKWWGKGRYKKYVLKKAIIKQETRVKELKKFLRKNQIAGLKLDSKFEMYPLLITLHDEDMIKFNKTLVVPVWKLNRTIVDMLL